MAIKINPEMFEEFINIIRDESSDGSQLQMGLTDLSNKIGQLNDTWQCDAAMEKKAEFEVDFRLLKDAMDTLHENGRTICQKANELLEISSRH